ncbi:unnamed protein product, partial [Brassica napus]
MWISIPKRQIVVFDNICSSISPEELDVPNGKTMRDKMVVDIFQELPDAHEFENKDNDTNLGAYEGYKQAIGVIKRHAKHVLHCTSDMLRIQ